MKLTKKSYNRRIYTFGVLIFLAVALMSTGFAAWVMSTNATAEDTGAAHVGVITDGQLSFVENSENKKVTFTGDNEFRFDAREDDQSGEIKASKVEGAEYENLTAVFSVTITPAEYLDGLQVKLELPETFFAAADKNYIVLPDCAVKDLGDESETGITIKSTSTGGKDIDGQAGDDLARDSVAIDTTTTPGNITITYTINFEWGTAFGGVNPGVYLDTYKDDSNNPLSYEEKVDRFVAFKKTIHGLQESVSNKDALNYEPTDDYQYTLDLVAISK